MRRTRKVGGKWPWGRLANMFRRNASSSIVSPSPNPSDFAVVNPMANPTKQPIRNSQFRQLPNRESQTLKNANLFRKSTAYNRPSARNLAPIDENMYRPLYISRHANSCNNIIQKNLSITNLKKDPSISISGIITSLCHYPSHLESYTGGCVFVSVMVRTWETAVLLYGRTKYAQPIKLVVGPFLKEEGDDPGNTPESYDIQKIKFQNFLYFLHQLRTEETFSKSKELENIISNTYVIYVGTKAIHTFEPVDISPTKLSDAIIQYIKKQTCNKDKVDEQDFPTAKLEMSVIEDPEETKSDNDSGYTTEMLTYNPSGIDYFYRFADKYLNLIGSKDKFIFAISHSHLMQAVLKLKLLTHLSLQDKQASATDIKKLFKCNLWTMKIEHIDGIITPTKYIMGVQKTLFKEVEFSNEIMCNQEESWADERYELDFARRQRAYQNRDDSTLINKIKKWTGTQALEPKRIADKKTTHSSGAQTFANSLKNKTGWSGVKGWLARKYLGIGGQRSKRRKHNRTFKKK